jgi:hypothetical protein
VPDAGASRERLLAEIGARVAGAICAKIDRCCSAAERMRVVGAGENFAACTETLGSFYTRQYTRTQELVASGRIAFDADRLLSCTTAYDAANCAAPGWTASQVCNGVLSGMLALGEACDSSFECGSHLCARGAGGVAVCTARKADREPCSSDGECASGFCGMTLLSGMCSSQRPSAESCVGPGFWLSF